MPKKKQKTDKSATTSWREKLDDEGLRTLDEYRIEKLKALEEQKKKGSKDWIDELIETFGKRPSKTNQDEKFADYELETDGTVTSDRVRTAIRETISSIEIPSPADL